MARRSCGRFGRRWRAVRHGVSPANRSRRVRHGRACRTRPTRSLCVSSAKRVAVSARCRLTYYDWRSTRRRFVEEMSDFHQSGVITTLHRLGGSQRLEARLAEYTQRRPVALVLPCLYSELAGPALRNIVEQLRRVNYLREIVVG